MALPEQNTSMLIVDTRSCKYPNQSPQWLGGEIFATGPLHDWFIGEVVVLNYSLSPNRKNPPVSPENFIVDACCHTGYWLMKALLRTGSHGYGVNGIGLDWIIDASVFEDRNAGLRNKNEQAGNPLFGQITPINEDIDKIETTQIADICGNQKILGISCLRAAHFLKKESIDKFFNLSKKLLVPEGVVAFSYDEKGQYRHDPAEIISTAQKHGFLLAYPDTVKEIYRPTKNNYARYALGFRHSPS